MARKNFEEMDIAKSHPSRQVSYQDVAFTSPFLAVPTSPGPHEALAQSTRRQGAAYKK